MLRSYQARSLIWVLVWSYDQETTEIVSGQMNLVAEVTEALCNFLLPDSNTQIQSFLATPKIYATLYANDTFGDLEIHDIIW